MSGSCASVSWFLLLFIGIIAVTMEQFIHLTKLKILSKKARPPLKSLSVGQSKLSWITGQLAAQRNFFADRNEPQFGPAVESTQFSDTIVVSCPADHPFYFGFLLHLFHTCAGLLMNNHYTRGAVVVGSIHHNGDSVFGPALIRAYELERYVAVYPRIIVDQTAAVLINQKHGSLSVEPGFTKNDILRVDHDGLYYLNIMTPPIGPPMASDTRMHDIRHCLQLVEQNMQADAGNERLLMKHHWMRRYLKSLSVNES